MTHPLEELRVEDERLHQLDKIMREKCKGGYYSAWEF